MPKHLLCIALILLSTPAYCEDRLAWGVMGVMGGTPAGAAAFTCSGDSNLACDNFDGGVATCGDNTSVESGQCWEAWTTTSASLTITNLATGLEGTYAKQINANSGGTYGTYTEYSAQDTAYAFVMVRFGVMSVASTVRTSFLQLNSNTASRCAVQVFNNGGTYEWCAAASGGTAGCGATSPSIAINTTYYIWMEYSKGTGANAHCHVWVSSTPTKPVSVTVESTDGTGVGTTNRMYVYSRDEAATDLDLVTIDKVRIGTSAFGDNGQ